MASSLADAGLLERIRRAGTRRGREEQQRYLIEGERLVERALRAGVQPEQLVVSDAFAASEDGAALLQRAKTLGVEVTAQPEALLLALAEGRSAGVCVALAQLPGSVGLETWLSARAAGSPALLLVLVDVVEPGNVGALARTALASGVTALVTTGASDPFHPKAVRSSMGSLFKLQLCVSPSLEHTLPLLRSAGYVQVATVARDGTELPRSDLGAPRLAVYVGNEARGLPAGVEDRADLRVTIPMPEVLDSFSVNAAAAIVLYEAQRQRHSARAP